MSIERAIELANLPRWDELMYREAELMLMEQELPPRLAEQLKKRMAEMANPGAVMKQGPSLDQLDTCWRITSTLAQIDMLEHHLTKLRNGVTQTAHLGKVDAITTDLQRLRHKLAGLRDDLPEVYGKLRSGCC